MKILSAKNIKNAGLCNVSYGWIWRNLQSRTSNNSNNKDLEKMFSA